ncbi:hypothetical protein AVEN_179317-1 [Araneus ventricosus]|uniref:STPR domain-containing protein n=1 Tax=Araneus ventricosus TaxID=182803 RepID=A0A4Y2H383_ARAVE|nr:hypothetical protein AVEN_179317-1 [Araneus ventricosus]
MPKRKGGITWDAARRQQAIRKRERRVAETVEERYRLLSTVAQRGQDRRAEETEEQNNSRLSVMAQRGQKRRAEETGEQRNSRLSDMAQCGQERRAEEIEKQRNNDCQLEQHGQDKPEETEEQSKPISRTSHLHPAEAGGEKFAQLYVLDSDLATCRRMERRENSECNPKLMRNIDEIIRRVNPFADAYKMMWELKHQVLQEEGHDASENVTIYISDDRLHISQHRGRYNAPKLNEIAIVFRSSCGIPPNNRDICIYPRQRELSRISTHNPNCDPMTYTLFFPCGERGFRINQSYSELQIEYTVCP